MADRINFEKDAVPMLDEENPLPSSSEEARELALSMVGLVKPAVFARSISRWWDRLIAAQTAKEKLGCQLMIDALGYARGLHDHERGAELAKQNQIKSDLELRRESADRAIARWS